jgi:hypothetical protein
VTAKGEVWRGQQRQERGRGSRVEVGSAYPRKGRERRCLAGVEVTVSSHNEGNNK